MKNTRKPFLGGIGALLFKGAASLLLGWPWAFLLAPVALLIAVSFQNYLLFHTLVELFTVVIAVLLCVVAWQTYRFSHNHFLMYLACGYFWIGSLDLVHTLIYKGMNIFPVVVANPATQFWIATRYFEALLLLSAPLLLVRSVKRTWAFCGFGVIAIVLFNLIMSGNFPDAFVEGQGLTSFKVTSEYVIIGLLVGALAHLSAKHALLDPQVFLLLMLSIVLTMAAELAFTFYVSVYGFSNLVGHIFKLFSFWLIFIAIIKTTLIEPYLTIQTHTHDLGERVKELGGIYRVSEIINHYDLPFEETMQMVVESLPAAWQYPALTVARITLNGRKYTTEYFEETSWKQARDILVDGEQVGEIEVFYLKEKPQLDEGPFLKEERDLINSIAMKIQDYIYTAGAKNKLIESEEQFRNLYETSPVGYVSISAKDRSILRFNRAFHKMLGYEFDELRKMKVFDFYAETPDGKPKAKEVFERFRNGQRIQGEELQMARNDGTSFWIELSANPIFDDDGNVIESSSVVIDINDRKEAERIRLQTQKMESLGSLASGVAHDINNMLLPILNLIPMVMKNIPEVDRDHKKLAMSLRAAERMKVMAENILSFSRDDVGETLEIDLIEPLLGAIDILRATLPSTISIKEYLTPGVGAVIADPKQIEAIVMNLVSNARDAMEGMTGELTISLKREEVDKVLASKVPNLKPGRYAKVYVTDTGCGMDEQTQKRIFDPLFTTKGQDRGTGLGLSMVFGTVVKYDGAVQVTSEVGKGTTFEIYFPVASI